MPTTGSLISVSLAALAETSSKSSHSVTGGGDNGGSLGPVGSEGQSRDNTSDGADIAPPATDGPGVKRLFFGTVDIDPARARFEFGEIVDEVLMLFASRADTKVRVSIEISAETDGVFDEKLQRAVRENCTQLRFKNKDFES